MIKRAKVKGTDQTKVTFILPHDPNEPDIYVAGDFNNWNTSEMKLVKRVNDTRSAAITLDPGRYAFRYCNANGDWFNDEAADAYQPNVLGGDDCVVVVE